MTCAHCGKPVANGRWVYDDGGRYKAGYKGHAGDCSTRAVAIAMNLPYQSVYDLMNAAGKQERRRKGRPSGARTGVKSTTLRRVIGELGWQWTPTMTIGSGCRVHLRADELPAGRLIVRVSKHLVALIDGVIHDTHDCSRGGTRCVYGWWAQAD
jgi:hypothetical protein